MSGPVYYHLTGLALPLGFESSRTIELFTHLFS
jgi:hypothetical protein